MEVLEEVLQVFEEVALLERIYLIYLTRFLDEVFHLDDQERKLEEKPKEKISNMI
jgi:hypothetical protein